MLWLEVSWNPKEGRAQHYHILIRQPISSAFTCLWPCGENTEMMSSINEAMELFFITEIPVLGLKGSWLVAKWKMLRNNLLTENTHFYTNTAIKGSLILVWSKYGFSSIKQCLSKRHCEYQFSRKKEEKLHNKYNSPESPQSFNIF